jgi:hypothetical protein
MASKLTIEAELNINGVTKGILAAIPQGDCPFRNGSRGISVNQAVQEVIALAADQVLAGKGGVAARPAVAGSGNMIVFTLDLGIIPKAEGGNDR